MRFALDVVLLDREGRVLAVRRGVRPWRIVLPVSGSYATLELPAGSADLEVGTPLCVTGCRPAPCNSSAIPAMEIET